MFKKSFWRGRIVSDEGFSVRYGRDALLYEENGKKISATIDPGRNAIVIFENSLARFADDPMTTITPDEKQRILNNIQRALESQKLSVLID